uniref:Uncharacterized protein n=2 Tax=Alexandrium catenella TaxID=2925 RepID=A0A7S1W074_ALECA
MAPTLLGHSILSLALGISLGSASVASPDWPLDHLAEDDASAEEQAVVLLQDVTGLSLMRQQIKLAADTRDSSSRSSTNGDAFSFAQTDIKIDAVPATASFPSAPLGKEETEEEETCSLQGLTPGVCAMAALARAGPKGGQTSSLDFFRPERLEKALFSEIESVLAGTHAGITADSVAELERDLAGPFASLPKNSAGLLEPAAVRYLVHQRFLRRHAWYIRSLNPAGEAQTPASEGEALRGHVPQHLQELIQNRQGGRGLGVRELAALVATLEHLIQGDMGERLKAAYASHNLPINGTASVDEVSEVLFTFMAHFLSQEHRSGYAISPKQARKERRELELGYGGWSEVEDIVTAAVLDGKPEMRFEETLAAAKEVMKQFAGYSVEECRGVKTTLAAMPGGPSGRVLLADFHREAVNGELIFSETREYLQKLGALDTTLPAFPSVLIPNYVVSPSNCVGTTSFFDMCCQNECESILEDIERALQSAEATPKDIAGALAVRGGDAGWPSAPLQRELEEAAEAHGGRVGLHGLAFARWLNSAFPLECPRPRPGDYGEEELPDAGVEFQAVAAVQVSASKAELLKELQAEEGNMTLPFPGEELQAGKELRALAAEAREQMAAGATRGLRASPLGLGDVTSFAQDGVQAVRAERREEPSDQDGGKFLRARAP